MGDKEEQKRAEGIALKMLSFRGRSTQEVRDKLNQQGIKPSVREKVLALFTDYGYLNDQSLALQLALSLYENKGLGFARIEATLRARGLSPDLVKETISQLKENHGEDKTALQIMKRRFSNFDFHNSTSKEKQRIIQFFRRRGFSWETISRVLRV